jgi:RHS repeat-associated protein
LARINYGELHVETQDFAYTIQGWIKQVQGQVFAYALGYNNTDYSPIGAATQLATPIATNKGLYNGNIATMSSKTQVIDNNNPWVQQYTYDQLNRIKTSTTQGTNQYATSYSYDANGNILNLTRKNNAGGDIDNLTYNYENKAAGYQRNTNRLRSVDDAVTTTAQTDDIEDQQEDNYRYDATGNLVYDRSEEIEKVEWTVSGKVLKVIRTATSSKPNLEFTYDASGNRIAKKVIQPNGDYKTTFYVRDASGNVMAVYKTSGTTNLSLEEQHIYGSSRLGIFKKDKNRKSTTRALGERRYELTDHLGNVRVVLSDYKKAESIILSATDYYPFGMVARTYTSPEEYRYGFNGQERDSEWDDYYAFEYRIYDSRLGRFLSIDPLTKSYPFLTPFSFCENRVIDMVELEGLEAKPTFDKNGKIIWTPVIDNTSTAALQHQAQMRGAVLLSQPLYKPQNTQLTVGGLAGTQQYRVTAKSIDLYGNFFLPIDVTKRLIKGEYVSPLELGIEGLGILPIGKILKPIKYLKGAGGELLQTFVTKFENQSTHLTDLDLAGAIKDIFGNPVVINGKTFNHLKEVEDALRGVGNQLDQLNKEIDAGKFTGEVLEQAKILRTSLQKQKDKIQKVLSDAKKQASSQKPTVPK